MSNEFKWTISPVNKQPAKLVLDYLIERGRDLEKQTEGKVIGSLVKINHPLIEIARRVAEISNGTKPQRINKNAKDAATIYERESYQFIIYDRAHSYELCVFTIRCNAFMPVYIEIDATIAEEEEIEEYTEANNLEEFEDLFSRIVGSTKVIYIISQLNNLPDELETQALTDSANEQSTPDIEEQNES